MNQTEIYSIQDTLFADKQIKVDILRDDLLHPSISGNKFHKLKYNIANAKKKGNSTLLTFGGAYSNHIAATAVVGKEQGFRTIGIIRGEETLPLNPTLQLCVENGMEIHYLDRSTYRLKHTQDFKDYLRNEYGHFYLIPEGGTNYYAINGCMEIVPNYTQYDYICCPIGTGGTIAGISIANNGKAKILGFPALKGGDFLYQDIEQHIHSVTSDKELTEELLESLELITEYHFGGYAKLNKELINFVQNFYQKHHIKWDIVYNGKMTYGVYELIKEGYFPENSSLLLIHTGGLQGIKGIEERNKITVYED